MEKKREVSRRRIVSMLAVIMGLAYVAIASNLMRQAIRIVAAADNGLLPGLGIVLVSAGGLAWIAGRLGR